jgi:hypothetical protein
MKFMSMLVMSAAAIAASSVAKPARALDMESIESITAKVEAIDVGKRLLTLRGPKGRTETIEVHPDVRNLAQVKVGDQLVVRYYESIGAEIKPKGTSATLNTVEKTEGLARRVPGEKPGASVGSVTTTTVVIQSVDKKTHVVKFTAHDGHVRDVHVQDPRAREFIATLKKGDEVELTYTEALAVSIEAVK